MPPGGTKATQPQPSVINITLQRSPSEARASLKASHEAAFASHPHYPHRQLAPVPKTSSSYALVALLPDEYFTLSTAGPTLHSSQEASSAADTDFKALRAAQQAELRKLAIYKNGRRRFDPTAHPGQLQNWSSIYSSTVDGSEGPFGDEKLEGERSKVVQCRDGGRCGCCRTKKTLDTCHMIARRQNVPNDDTVRWMRKSRVDPYFRKDLPSNVVTFCKQHHDDYDAWSWVFVSSEMDLDALIAYENADYVRRQALWFALRKDDPTTGPPPRTVPEPCSLSGWCEYIPLSYTLDNTFIGHYAVQITNEALESRSPGGSAYTEEATPRVRYSVPKMAQPVSNCYYDADTGAMLIWLGLSDLSAQAIISASLFAFGKGRHTLTPRTKVMHTKVQDLHDLYNKPLRIKNLPGVSLALESERAGVSDSQISQSSELSQLSGASSRVEVSADGKELIEVVEDAEGAEFVEENDKSRVVLRSAYEGLVEQLSVDEEGSSGSDSDEDTPSPPVVVLTPDVPNAPGSPNLLTAADDVRSHREISFQSLAGALEAPAVRDSEGTAHSQVAPSALDEIKRASTKIDFNNWIHFAHAVAIEARATLEASFDPELAGIPDPKSRLKRPADPATATPGPASKKPKLVRSRVAAESSSTAAESSSAATTARIGGSDGNVEAGADEFDYVFALGGRRAKSKAQRKISKLAEEAVVVDKELAKERRRRSL